MSPYEKTEALEAIRSHIMAAWRTDEIRRTKPSPQVTVYIACLLQRSALAIHLCLFLQLQQSGYCLVLEYAVMIA